MIYIICTITFFTTMAGGLFALKFKDKLPLILGFSAGAVIGVVFFDLLPEALELGSRQYHIGMITSIAALGFMFYMMLDRLALLHKHSAKENNENRGNLGAGSLSVHSLLDGVAIGLAFQISSSIWIIIAVAVMVHDFSDGVNTVSIILKNDGPVRTAFKWLLIDALAPVIGVISTFFFKLPQSLFGLVLALFAGFFLYIGASDLLPESQHRFPSLWTTFMTILGIAIIYGAIRLAG